ncbi:MAG TPA: tetratricopeptide repeat protein [Candidatus Binatia bacterium]
MDEEDPRSWLTGAGIAAFHQERYEEAIRYLEQAATYDPSLKQNETSVNLLADARRRLAGSN